MSDNFFKGLFDAETTVVIKPEDFLLCLGVSLALGIILALSYAWKTRCSKSFVFTLGLLPAVVCVVILMVNGNIGTGVAVAGAFSLVRFRSVPGTAKEIGVLFLAMGTGLIAGMGYLGYASLFTLLMCIVTLLFNALSIGKKNTRYKTLSITIPENLSYNEVFDDLLNTYASEHELTRVKTTNMGSMYRLTYNLMLRPNANEKEMIDQLRCRNGNLEISLCAQDTTVTEL